MSSLFRARNEEQISRLIADHPLAWVVCPATGDASPLPLLAETDATGRVVRLLGHLARANPLAAAMERDGQMLVLFQGPQAYISPHHAGDRQWGPTWNYAVLRINGQARLRPDLNDEALHRLVAAMEKDRATPWHPAEMGARYATLAQHIVAFEVAVTHLDVRFKLGQDERPAVFAHIVAALGDSPLASLMRENHPDAES
jgi:transcriptional regulator